MKFKRKILFGCFVFSGLLFAFTLCFIFLFLRYFVFGNDTHPLNVSTEKAQKIILSEIFFAPETFIVPLETILVQNAGIQHGQDSILYVKCSIPDNQLTNIVNNQYWKFKNRSICEPFGEHRPFQWCPSTKNNIYCILFNFSTRSEILVMNPINDYRILYISTSGSNCMKFSKEFGDFLNNSRQ